MQNSHVIITQLRKLVVPPLGPAGPVLTGQFSRLLSRLRMRRRYITGNIQLFISLTMHYANTCAPAQRSNSCSTHERVIHLALTYHGLPIYIRNCCNKTRRLVGLLYRRFYRCTNSPSLLRLYKSFVRPNLEYATIAWNPHLKGEIEAIENVQKFSLRVCLKSWDSDYDELLRVSNLPPLHKRRSPIKPLSFIQDHS